MEIFTPISAGCKVGLMPYVFSWAGKNSWSAWFKPKSSSAHLQRWHDSLNPLIKSNVSFFLVHKRHVHIHFSFVGPSAQPFESADFLCIVDAGDGFPWYGTFESWIKLELSSSATKHQFLSVSIFVHSNFADASFLPPLHLLTMASTSSSMMAE